MMYAPIKKLSRVNATLQQAMAASERIFEILDTHSEVPERAGAQPLARLRQAIEFRNVSFSYDGVEQDDPAGRLVQRARRAGGGDRRA